MNFKLDPNADVNGTSLCGSLPDITAAMMQQTFGDHVDDTYAEPLKGYGGNTWYFVSDDGQVVTVYDRWNQMCVGSHSNTIFEPFAAWLRSKVRESRSSNSKLASHNGLNHLFIRVAGVTFDNRQQIIARLHLMQAVRLQSDPLNPHDCYAVRVETLAGEQIGFVPKEQSRQISELLNSGEVSAVGWVNELTGGTPEYSNRGVVIGVEISEIQSPSQIYYARDEQEDDFEEEDWDQAAEDLAKDWGYGSWEAFQDTID